MQCEATTKAGARCSAFAVHGSDPPRCSAHLGRNAGAGAPPGNQNRRTHGFYSRHFTQAETEDLTALVDGSLDSEINVVRVALRRALAVLQDDGSDPEVVAALVPLVFAGGRTVARLMRDKRILSGEGSAAIMSELAEALETLGEEWGVEL